MYSHDTYAVVFSSIILLLGWASLEPRSSRAQHFTDCLTQNDTGTSATLVLEDTIDTHLPNGATLEKGDEVALVTDDGTCAGSNTWDPNASAVSVSAAGPNASSVTDAPSGYARDEALKYKIWDASEGIVYDLGKTAEYASCDGAFLCRSDGHYENDAIFTVTTLGSKTPLPVEFSRFEATTRGTTAILSWTTLSETNNVGFAIQHRPPSTDTWTKQGFVDGHGTTRESHTYTFELSSLRPGRHTFRLRQVNTNGKETLSEPRSVQVEMESAFVLSKVTPNPVRETGHLTLRLRTSQHVTIALYNTLGQRMSVLHDGVLAANTKHTFHLGEQTSSGTYFLRVRGASFSATRRMVVVE